MSARRLQVTGPFSNVVAPHKRVFIFLKTLASSMHSLEPRGKVALSKGATGATAEACTLQSIHPAQRSTEAPLLCPEDACTLTK